MKKLMDDDENYAVPEKINAGLIAQLAGIADKLASAADKAVNQSRLTAGEPTQHIALHVATFGSDMSPEELRRYALTKELPSHVRVRGGSRDSVKDASGQVIDAVSEPTLKKPSNG